MREPKFADRVGVVCFRCEVKWVTWNLWCEHCDIFDEIKMILTQSSDHRQFRAVMQRALIRGVSCSGSQCEGSFMILASRSPSDLDFVFLFWSPRQTWHPLSRVTPTCETIKTKVHGIRRLICALSLGFYEFVSCAGGFIFSNIIIMMWCWYFINYLITNLPPVLWRRKQ